jgi:hypothetical protein
MGSYYGTERFRQATVDSRPVITPREYASAFALATREVLGGDGHLCRSRGIQDGAPLPPRDVMFRALICRVRRRPTDPTAHRRLGAALLDAGDARAGIRHLDIALRLLLADVAKRESLHGALCARLEIGLLLIPLISMAARSGKPELLRRLVGLLP